MMLFGPCGRISTLLLRKEGYLQWNLIESVILKPSAVYIDHDAYDYNPWFMIDRSCI